MICPIQGNDTRTSEKSIFWVLKSAFLRSAEIIRKSLNVFGGNPPLVKAKADWKTFQLKSFDSSAIVASAILAFQNLSF
jgi:hypothetical protein